MSLGVSLTPAKTCNFDCVYCQLGRTTLAAAERKEYIPISEVLAEFRAWLAANPDKLSGMDYISLSGSGEPTLNIKIGELIREIKKLAPAPPLAVITNSSFLADPAVRRQLAQADVIVPSLDAATQQIFEKVDRPMPSVTLESIVAGLIELRKEYRGKIWLEVMLVKGSNDDLRHIRKLAALIEKINPDRVQLNSPVRATSEAGILPVAKPKLEKIKEILGEKCQVL
jgi:wyosine [tRNA(Phe)-imidazoG37] synthetase (radical SAM superfamily)